MVAADLLREDQIFASSRSLLGVVVQILHTYCLDFRRAFPYLSNYPLQHHFILAFARNQAPSRNQASFLFMAFQLTDLLACCSTCCNTGPYSKQYQAFCMASLPHLTTKCGHTSTSDMSNPPAAFSKRVDDIFSKNLGA